jgi:hypothetical protein
MAIDYSNLVPLARADQDPRVLLKRSTLYKHKHTKKHPKQFVKIGGRVFIDLNEQDKILEASRR